MAQSLEGFRNALKIPELRQRIVFTLLMLAVYRLGAHIPTPGINGGALARMIDDTSPGMLQFYDLFSGGAFERATVFALGIMPYISASIIMQLLVSVVPALERLQKEGAEGQKKITEYTRYGTIVLGVVQSIGIGLYLQGMNAAGSEPIVANPGLGFLFMCVLSFTAGTAFIMWQGEQISEYGVGNGMSLLIFVSIIAGAPAAIARMFSLFNNDQLNVLQCGLLVLGMVAVVAGVILVTQGQRRIPVQYPRQVKGRRIVQGGRNYLPLRVNQAGVIPIIFAASILMLPTMVLGSVQIGFVQSLNNMLQMDHWFHDIVYAVLIIFFCFFYTAITFNPVEIADNLKKYGGVIMGVRPGRATADYLHKVMTRITWVGSLFLAGIALVPKVVHTVLGVYDWQIAMFFGGTSLLILVGVAIDTIRQIEQHLVMRNYEGFVKGRPFRGRR